jgi:hypothetical protein
MNEILNAFANSVNAYRSGDSDAIARANDEWKTLVPEPVDSEYVEGPMDCEIPDLSDREYDRVADAYERSRGL